MQTKTLLVLLLLMPVSLSGQELVKWALGRLDSMAAKGIDRRYIELPDRPWTVELQGKMSHSSMQMSTVWDGDHITSDGEIVNATSSYTFKTHNGYVPSVGLKVSYRSTGIGFSRRLGKGKGSSFSFSSASGHYGINVQLKSFSTESPELTMTTLYNGVYSEESDNVNFDSPIKVRTQFLDAYYMFNGRRYSYAAANKPALIQRRSAGSLMAGIMYYHAVVDYLNETVSNIFLSSLMHNIGKQKVTQASIGAGYAYNWVPARGWLVSAVAMPMLTLYNRTKLYRYNVKYLGDKGGTLDVWDEPAEMFVVSENGQETTPNHIVLNFDGHFSVVHNWNRLYMRLSAQNHRFKYGHDASEGWFSEWGTQLSVGYRF